MPKSIRVTSTDKTESKEKETVSTTAADAELIEMSLAHADSAAARWHRRAASAPLWMLTLASRSRIAAGAVSIVLAALLGTAVLTGIYVVVIALAALMVPGLPSAVVSTMGVSPGEVTATNDAFMFMGVMPVLFVAVTAGVTAGIVVYRILVWTVRFVLGLVSCAVVSKQAVSRMAQRRREHLPQRRVVKRRHLVDYAAGTATE